VTPRRAGSSGSPPAARSGLRGRERDQIVEPSPQPARLVDGHLDDDPRHTELRESLETRDVEAEPEDRDVARQQSGLVTQTAPGRQAAFECFQVVEHHRRPRIAVEGRQPQARR
jgi:hypothetical protein